MGHYRYRGPGQHEMIIIRVGWPRESATFPTKKEAKAWERKVEAAMDAGTWNPTDKSHRRKSLVAANPKINARTPLGDLIRRYLVEVIPKQRRVKNEDGTQTAGSPPEEARLNRFLREEEALCKMAVGFLRPEHFKDYAARRLTQYARRGMPGGRGDPKPRETHEPKRNKDGSVRKNAAKPKHPPKPPKPISASSVIRELTVLEGVFKHYMSDLRLPASPVNRKAVQRPSANDERMVRVTEEQSEKLLDVLEKCRNKTIAAAVKFARLSSGRLGSVLRLLWSDVDLDKREVIWRDIKNSRQPNIVRNHKSPLSRSAVELLRSLPRPAGDQDGRVFPVSKSALSSAFKRAREKVGLSHFRIHDQRHEYPSVLGESGATEFDIAAVTGHRDSRSIKRYVHADVSKMAQRLDELEARANGTESEQGRLIRELTEELEKMRAQLNATRKAAE